ncbi:hypothetical protein GCM10017044_03980 [Kordiimonas sediminis]|uniref:TraB/GumN family protein n=1 Tax=Kordiimonas sediminis TaxID=1735581 RepID=A0A919AJW5_9PROT|nr:TraB/GumN family protein [Kordiimonas sediminis]GHF13204.1 hypothetical protein GCM10017044_03980 [Kordiimonas sediminis]
MKQVKSLIILFFISIFSTSAVTASSPALWMFGDEDTKIYLFGTVHILEKDAAWGTPALKTAFDTADALILEVSEEELKKAAPLMAAAGKLPAGQTLRTTLGDGLYSDVSRQIGALNLPRNAFDQARPWFATLSLGVLSTVRAGFDPNMGADQMLLRMAKTKGKPVYGLETAEQQVAIFAQFSPAEERQFVIDSLSQLQDIATHTKNLQNAWLNGDVDTLDTLVNGAMETTPEFAKRALEDRNRAWATILADNLQSPGTFLVAVGAGHLVGDKSVQVYLNDAGITVSRIQ